VRELDAGEGRGASLENVATFPPAAGRCDLVMVALSQPEAARWAMRHRCYFARFGSSNSVEPLTHIVALRHTVGPSFTSGQYTSSIASGVELRDG
jgi:hypothetical protein